MPNKTDQKSIANTLLPSQVSAFDKGMSFAHCLVVSGAVFGLALVSLYWGKGPGVSWLEQFKSQDVIWLLVLALSWNTLFNNLNHLELGNISIISDAGKEKRRWIISGTVLFCFIFSWFGASIIYHDYSLSLDEFIDLFQVKTFLSGDVFAIVDSAWREFGYQLQPVNIKYDMQSAVWNVGVLPMRAVFQSFFYLLGDISLAESISSASTVVLLYLISRIIWPELVLPRLVALVFLVGSTQFLIMSVSPYAMTTMLFFDVLWLYLYLVNTRISHLLGIIIVFLASGLHHWQNFPIFVLPFLIGMLVQRQWKIFLIYTLATVFSAAFWKMWPALSLTYLYDIHPQSTGGTSSVASSAINLLFKRGPDDIVNWFVNIYRFVSWQHILLIPVVYVAVGNWKTMPTILKTITFGILFQALIYAALYPSQGHGWGYRFMHEQIVGLSLLAAFGWMHLSKQTSTSHFNPNRLLLGSTIVMLFLALPLRAIQVNQSVQPYADADKYIKNIDADIVLLEVKSGWYSQDLVRNHPKLSNRPLVLALQTLRKEQIERLCSQHQVNYVLFDTLYKFGIPAIDADPVDSIKKSFQYMTFLEKSGCVKAPEPSE